MWYFSRILGVGLACGAGILSTLWHELHMPEEPLSE